MPQSDDHPTPAAADAPLRIGIAGCSLARPRYGAAFALSSRTVVSALADADVKLMRAWAKVLAPDIGMFADVDAMAAAGTSLDALVIDVPLAQRAAALLAALPLCRGILCAPPFAPTLEETDRIVAEAEERGVWLVPAFPRRFDPVLAQAIDFAVTGEVGLVQQIRCDWSFPLSRTYGAELGADSDAGSWPALLQFAGCHAADMCRWCFGDVLTVSADVDVHDTAPLPGARRDTTPLLAIFVLGQENGPATCHFARSRSVSPSERYTFHGSLGHLEAVVSSSAKPGEVFPALTIHRPGVKPQAVPPPEFEGADLTAPLFRMHAMLEDFARQVASGSPPPGSAAAARAALEVVHAAYLAAQSARKITLPLHRSPELVIT